MASAGKMTIDIRDAATPWLKWAMERFPEFRRKALKSTGWYGMTEIKQGIKSRAPGGKRYKRHVLPAKKRAKLEQKKTARFPMLGKLRKAVGYQYRANEGAVLIGWLSQSAIRLGNIHEHGYSYATNPWVKLKFNASGLPFGKGKTTIQIPARPTIAPMAAYLARRWAPYMEEKIWSYLQKGEAPSQKPTSKRKYIVLGAM